MLSNKAALAAIGAVALVGASATGAFLASRRADPAAVATASSISADAVPTSGVEATEAVVEDPVTPPASAPAASPARPAAPVGNAGPTGQPPCLTDATTAGGSQAERAGPAGRARSQPAGGCAAFGNATR